MLNGCLKRRKKPARKRNAAKPPPDIRRARNRKRRSHVLPLEQDSQVPFSKIADLPKLQTRPYTNLSVPLPQSASVAGVSDPDLGQHVRADQRSAQGFFAIASERRAAGPGSSASGAVLPQTSHGLDQSFAECRLDGRNFSLSRIC